MAVYLHSSGLICAKNCEKHTALQLGQSLDLPYFNAFDKPLLNLAELVELLALQIEQTMAKAGWQITELAEIPILLGSTAYTISDCEWRFTNGQSLPTTPNITAIAERLKQRFGSPVWSFATSCTSSAQAIGYATKMIEQGKCRKSIVLGFEMFNRLTFEHFQAMGLLAQSADEKGIILGEGIGCVLLSDEPSDCQISALVSLTDNGSLTNSNPDLLKDLIKQILQKSSLGFSEIDAIKPHFVGGIFDETEQAVLQTFGNIPPLVLPKKQFGHTLGASGAMEMAWLLEQLKSENKLQIILNYFLGFGGSHIGWILKWK